MQTVHLGDSDVAAITALVDELATRHQTVETAAFHQEAKLLSEELPRGLRRALHEYRLAEPTGTLVVSGLPVADGDLGPTPGDWRHQPTPPTTLRPDISFFLLGCVLGEPIAWATQQDGRIMHDVFPIKGFEHDQIGWGSEEDLTWHTEDAFHPLRTDYLGLMCLRNPDDVETTIGEIADAEFTPEIRAELFREQFHILPDDSHRPKNAAGSASLDSGRVAELKARSLARVDAALAEPRPVPVLFGDPEAPYVCFDPHYMRGAQGEHQQRVLDEAAAEIDKIMTGVVLQPGDVVFVDNYRVVHGRKPFKARFDGTDRWLRRLNIARDLRKSRDSRLDATSRVIY
ncbi:Fe(II)/alpha-ketoglutarate-dependent arginine beta-hydroxylase [Crossiella equi]|uniref:Fe(II)/alpha-ketoglutarate-dependent arginine beta-hydroxylase n=1 Tax=Crossiella equi TaxID=130796 RepID=A0ABS5ARZ8_9PSEU|nr:guanitoxin biosynthesis L-enduracididine beta-hydroxylase GntD [Crossiella equi]MBP2479344.1 Fe(II)/alpha-ketoglutarate-dependent arginine beta-hydroxylase [Crossiella equi]